MPQNPFTTPADCVSDYTAVTTSDTVNLGFQARGVVAAGAGNAVLVSAQGNTVSVALAAGVPLTGICFVRVNATGTTATGLVALR